MSGDSQESVKRRCGPQHSSSGVEASQMRRSFRSFGLAVASQHTSPRGCHRAEGHNAEPISRRRHGLKTCCESKWMFS
jgi:hypothetical protein